MKFGDARGRLVNDVCQADGGARAWKRRWPNVDGAASAWGANWALPATIGAPYAGASAGTVDAPILMTTQIAQYSNGKPIGFDAGSPGSTIDPL